MAEQKKEEQTNGTVNSTSAATNIQQQNKEIPNLGALDEDDEFEEFEAQDWKDKDTSLAHLSNEGGATGLGMSGERGGAAEDHLWEDNWDDDDVEDDFGQMLRGELEKQSGKQTQAMATS